MTSTATAIRLLQFLIQNPGEAVAGERDALLGQPVRLTLVIRPRHNRVGSVCRTNRSFVNLRARILEAFADPSRRIGVAACHLWDGPKTLAKNNGPVHA